jgi:predicted RNA binding protein YcfA (HicA-like mRNA interferase family)
MARRLHNWTYVDVTDLLRENGFTFFKEVGGSHQAWIKRGDGKTPDRIVGLHFTHSSYPLGSLKRIVRQSGINEDEWIEWAGS